EPWATDLKIIATLPNVVCKISGLTTEADWQRWQPADLEFYITHAIECFGYDRIMFGGDWPVATLATDYRRWVETLLPLVSAGGISGMASFFKGNAERIYHV
ncbi:MAG: amidohydrolase family protein, partial [Verrucomicrobia bacterium]|nr:amidohydrolase family protein [Verrucomicrobiota bacterium]